MGARQVGWRERDYSACLPRALDSPAAFYQLAAREDHIVHEIEVA